PYGSKEEEREDPQNALGLPELVTTGRGLISARPKGGKSYAAAQIADALHHQKPLWWCPAPSKPWKTLYIMLDEPIASHLEQLSKFVPGSEFDLVHFQLKELLPDDTIGRYPLNNAVTLIRAQRLIEKKKPDYVIWDGLTFLDSSANFNARESVMQLY